MADKKSIPPLKPYAKAWNKVKELKQLYAHIAWFIPGSILIILAEPGILAQLREIGVTDIDFLNWVAWNIRLLPMIWIMVIIIKGICIYTSHHKKPFRVRKPRLLEKWEEKQLAKYLKEENSSTPNSPVE